MVSGLVTSPDDQSLICFDDASPMRIASKSLMSITVVLRLFLLQSSWRSVFEVDGLDVLERADGSVFVLEDEAAVEPERVDVLEGLVGRKRQVAVGVDAVLALLDLLARGLAGGRAERAGREVDPELLRGAEQLVVLLADLDLAAVLGDDADV